LTPIKRFIALMNGIKMKMMERKAYTAFGEMGFGETGRHRMDIM